MSGDGWVKVHRQIMRSAVWAKAELLHLWIYCLVKANHKEKWVSIEGVTKPVQVMPGQFITGRFELHKGIYGRRKRKSKSPLTVWNWLQTLRDMANLELISNNRYTLVTICNWEKYQSRPDETEQADEQQPDNSLTTDYQQTITNKNDKNDKEVKPPPPAGTHQAFIEYFHDEYQRRTGLPYSFQGGKDGAAVKKLIDAYTPDDLKAMVDAMFADAWGKENASPAILWSQRNKWRQASTSKIGDPEARRKHRELAAQSQGLGAGEVSE